MPKSKENNGASALDRSVVTLLLDAEKKACDILEESRKKKASKLKLARDDAAAEIEKIKKECEDRLNKLLTDTNKSKMTSVTSFEQELNRKVIDLKSAYGNRSQIALDYVLETVLDVEIGANKNLR